MAFFVPRLRKSFDSAVVDEEIGKSIRSVVKCERPTAEQMEAVKMFLSGKDVFISLPTGSGKSACYCCLPSLYDALRNLSGGAKHHSIVVVVSPLVSLMVDQVAKLRRTSGLKAGYIGGDCDTTEVETGEFDIIFTSPESLLSRSTFRSMIGSQVYRDNLMCVAIDEAHLVEKWGNEFRRDFARLGEIRSLLSSGINVMALTATATSSTRYVVMKTLDMRDCHVIFRSPNKLTFLWKQDV